MADTRDIIAGWLFNFCMNRQGTSQRWADPEIGAGEAADRTLREAWLKTADQLLTRLAPPPDEAVTPEEAELVSTIHAPDVDSMRLAAFRAGVAYGRFAGRDVGTKDWLRRGMMTARTALRQDFEDRVEQLECTCPDAAPDQYRPVAPDCFLHKAAPVFLELLNLNNRPTLEELVDRVWSGADWRTGQPIWPAR